MATFVTEADVKKIADLIKIHLDESEYPTYAKQLNMVLAAADVFKEIDTNNVRETAQTHGLENVLADDIPEKSLDMDAYPNTKNFEDGYFVVKKVL